MTKLKFDKDGNFIRESINYKIKHDNLTKDMIKELKEQSKIIDDKEKRTFWCLKHKCFHRYLNKGKINQTYQKCLLSFNFYKFKEHMTNTEIFKLSFKKNWNQQKANYYK